LPGFANHRIDLAENGVLKVSYIQAIVADHFRIPPREMTSQRRSQWIARPRQVAMYMTRELTPKSYPDIGRNFGGRDHSTVIHACKRVEQMMREDANFRDDVASLLFRLTR
jgi:chromosomal replication initiator protein